MGRVTLVAVAVILSYAAGLLPSARVVAGRAGHDPTREGSGNPGATNVLRVAGARAGATVLLLDLVKGLVPTAVALAVLGRPEAAACWLAATLGHVFPVTHAFRGGKGVATAAGGCVVLHPLGAVALAALFALVAGVGRRVSLASVAIALGLPFAVALTGRPAWEVATAAAVGMLVVARHAANIRRLVRGEEPALSRAGMPHRTRSGDRT